MTGEPKEQTFAEFLLARFAEDTWLDAEWCEALRRIVDAYLDECSRRDVYQRDDAMAVEDENQRTSRRSSAARARGLEIALEAIASRYAEHPDCREEWVK